MKKIVKIVIGATLLLAVGATTASADVAKGQKLYMKKLKVPCDMNGAAVAGKHTQDEWKDIQEAGKLVDEIKVICPKAKGDALKDDFVEDYYDFFHEYGSDSGNVPSC